MSYQSPWGMLSASQSRAELINSNQRMRFWQLQSLKGHTRGRTLKAEEMVAQRAIGELTFACDSGAVTQGMCLHEGLMLVLDSCRMLDQKKKTDVKAAVPQSSLAKFSTAFQVIRLPKLGFSCNPQGFVGQIAISRSTFTFYFQWFMFSSHLQVSLMFCLLLLLFFY